MKKNDLFLAGALILMGAGAFCFLHMWKKPGSAVTVIVSGEYYGTYSLSEDQKIVVEAGNRLVIEDGMAFMEWADCPDGLCVHQGKISRLGETIVCLPNRVVTEVTEGETSGIDSIAG